MNYINQEIQSLRVAIEHINWMIQQPQYEDVKSILQARKKDYLDELAIKLDKKVNKL